MALDLKPFLPKAPATAAPFDLKPFLPEEPQTPLRRYAAKSGILPFVSRQAIGLSERLHAVTPPALSSALDRPVDRPGGQLSAVLGIVSGQRIRYNYETREYTDEAGQPLPAPTRAAVLQSIVGAASPELRAGFRGVARAQSPEQTALSGILPFVGRQAIGLSKRLLGKERGGGRPQPPARPARGAAVVEAPPALPAPAPAVERLLGKERLERAARQRATAMPTRTVQPVKAPPREAPPPLPARPVRAIPEPAPIPEAITPEVQAPATVTPPVPRQVPKAPKRTQRSTAPPAAPEAEAAPASPPASAPVEAATPRPVPPAEHPVITTLKGKATAAKTAKPTEATVARFREQMKFTSVSQGGVVPAQGDAYDLIVRRENPTTWILSARTPTSTQQMGKFSSPERLARDIARLQAEKPSLGTLADVIRKRSSTARGGQWKRQEREFVEGYEQFLRKQAGVEPEAPAAGAGGPVPGTGPLEAPRPETIKGKGAAQALEAPVRPSPAALPEGEAISEFLALPKEQRRLITQALDESRAALRVKKITHQGEARIANRAYTTYLRLAEQAGLRAKLGAKLKTDPTPAFFRRYLAQAEAAEVSDIPAAATRQNLAEVRAPLARRTEGGFLQAAAAAAPGTDLPPRLEEVLRLGRPGTADKIRQAIRRSREGLRTFFVFEGELVGARTAPGSSWQELRDDFRLWRDTPRAEVPQRVADDIVGVVAPLDIPGVHRTADHVIIRDFLEELDVADRAGRRASVPLGLSREELETGAQVAARRLTQADREAVVRYDRLKAAMRDEYLRRGLGDPEDFRQYHFRHFVLDYLDRAGGSATFVRGGLHQPTRTGLRARTGSERLINTDLIDVMQKELARFHLDNAAEDFFQSLKPKIDWLPKLSKDELQAVFGPKGAPRRAGQLVTLDDGTQLVTWQYIPGNRIFRSFTLDSRLTEGVMQRVLTAEELDVLLKGVNTPETKKVARQMMVLGQKHPMMLIDPKVAARLDRFIGGQETDELIKVTAAVTGMWKRAIVDVLGVPFQVRNMVGDVENGVVMAGRPGQVGRAAVILYKHLTGQPLEAGEQALFDLAKQYRVTRSGWTGSVLRENARRDPRLRHLLDPLARAQNLPEEILSIWETPAAAREDLMRLANFAANVERIQRGDVVKVSKAIDLAGIDPRSIRAAGKIAREAFVDYGARSRFEQQTARIGLAPFVTWYYQNTRNWMRLATRDPKTLALKAVPLYAAMMVWNNTGERKEIESALPGWQRVTPHVITGWRLPDGRPLVASFGTAAASAAQVVGFTKLFDLAQQVARGEKDLEAAAREAPKAMLGEAGRNLIFQMGPGIQTLAETTAYATTGEALDIRRGRHRIPERLQRTPTGTRAFLAQEARQLIPPAEIIARQFEEHRRLPAGTSPLIRAGAATGILRAIDTEGEAAQRQRIASAKATGAREEKLYAIERAFIEGRSWHPEARRQNERDGPRITTQEALRRLSSPRVRLERVEYNLNRETDPARLRALQRERRRLQHQIEKESKQRTPRSARPFAVPRP